MDDLYSLGQTENWAMEKLKEHIPLLCDWAKKFVAPFPHPDVGAIDFKTPEYPQAAEQPSVCVSTLKDIEENIWSPRFGLKGSQISFSLMFQYSGHLFITMCTSSIFFESTSFRVQVYSDLMLYGHPCFKPSNTSQAALILVYFLKKSQFICKSVIV